jgi:AraC-like DNA-binding protein
VDGRDDAAVWDVARPARPSQVAGVSMAGFRDLGVAAVGHRAIPHPGVTLVVEFGAGPLIVDDAAGQQWQGSLVAGLGFGAVRVRGENFEAVQVRLSPVITRAVLGVSPADLDGAVATLDDVWGRQAARLREQLSDASSWAERFALTDALLARRHQTSFPADPEVAWAWKRILAGRGRIRIDALAAEVGWSRKRLWSRFHSQIGLPPKRAATLVRFDHAAHRLAAGVDTARVAADGGYADQSHLHRDVVAFTGCTPSTVAREPWLAVDDIAWPTRTAGHRTPARSRPDQRAGR